jgi:hypothetical protein
MHLCIAYRTNAFMHCIWDKLAKRMEWEMGLGDGAGALSIAQKM